MATVRLTMDEVRKAVGQYVANHYGLSGSVTMTMGANGPIPVPRSGGTLQIPDDKIYFEITEED